MSHYQIRPTRHMITFLMRTEWKFDRASVNVAGTGVTTYSLHPGAVKTELQRHLDDSFFKGAQLIMAGLGKLFFKTPEEGAQTSIYCSVDENLADKTGLYYR